MLTREEGVAVRRHLAEQYNENNNAGPDAFDESRAAAVDADPAAVAKAEDWRTVLQMEPWWHGARG